MGDNRLLVTLPNLLLLASLTGCNSGPPQTTDQAICVWNQAYQENYKSDTVEDILENAADCYVLIDPFGSPRARDAIGEMQASGNAVGCYMSSGTCEDWRDDFEEIKEHCVTTPWGQWAGEYFVDDPGPGLRKAMEARIGQMATWGCDTVEFDNMDWAFDDRNRRKYDFAATATEAIEYNQALCDTTHSQGMGCMAKNTGRGAERFDAGTFESYPDEADWWEHRHLAGFLEEGGLALVVHYDEGNCNGVYADYVDSYGGGLSFICEDRRQKRYLHFNRH